MKIDWIDRKDRYWIVVGKKPAVAPKKHFEFETAKVAAMKLARKYPGQEFAVYHVKAIVQEKAPEIIEGQTLPGATAGMRNAIATTC